MSVFMSENTNVHDYKEVNDSLFSLSEKLRYYFRSLSPEDNFSPEAYLKYQEKNGKIAVLEKTEQGLQSNYEDLSEHVKSQIQLQYDEISLKVESGDVTNQLNLEAEDLLISGNRLELYGNNLVLDANNRLIYQGELIADAGRIAGWDIGGGEDFKYLYGNKTSKITADKVESDELMMFDELRVHGDTNLRRAKIELDHAGIETDKTTIFMNGFTGRHMDCGSSTVVCGTATAYEEIHCAGQISCKSCYTSRDGKTWSDRRLKKDIKDLTEEAAEESFAKLKPYRYRFRNTKSQAAGFMAQDIKRDFPESFGIVREKNGMLGLQYASFIPLLTKVIQRQTREIEELMKCKAEKNY